MPFDLAAANLDASHAPVFPTYDMKAPEPHHVWNAEAGGPKQAQRMMYTFSGGSVVAIAGTDFCILAADTRCASDGIIISRNLKKLHALNNQIVLGSWGCLTDVDEMRAVLDIRMKTYRHNHRKAMSLESASQMLSNVAYYRRFNPYYSFNILGGIDSQGRGAVYQYDAIGSFERYQYRAEGTGLHFIMPFLDNVINNGNRTDAKPTLSKEETMEIIKDAFVSAAERDVHTGDSIDLWVITKDGIETRSFALNAH